MIIPLDFVQLRSLFHGFDSQAALFTVGNRNQQLLLFLFQAFCQSAPGCKLVRAITFTFTFLQLKSNGRKKEEKE